LEEMTPVLVGLEKNINNVMAKCVCVLWS